MKKNILILLIIAGASICWILLMVVKSDPQRVILDISRNYAGIRSIATDTISFPGLLNFLTADDKFVYGYSNRKKALYRFDPDARRIDTLLYANSLFENLPSAIDRDPATNFFYLLNARKDRIYIFHPVKATLDSLDVEKSGMVQGQKCFRTPYFLFRSVDYNHHSSTIRRVDYMSHKDTILYSFAQYRDGGISSDGFFTKDPVSRKFFFIPFYNSEIICYNETDESVAKISTIDKTPTLNYSIPAGNGYTVSGKARIVNQAAACDSSHLLLLSIVSSRERNEPPGTVIDVYSTLTGKYERSLQIPYFKDKQAITMVKNGDRLIVGYGWNVIIYKIQYF